MSPCPVDPRLNPGQAIVIQCYPQRIAHRVGLQRHREPGHVTVGGISPARRWAAYNARVTERSSLPRGALSMQAARPLLGSNPDSSHISHHHRM